MTHLSGTVNLPTTGAKPILCLRAVHKSFGPVAALGPVDLAIRPGEFVALVGPSGCGKSTLFNILAGLLPAGSGSEVLLHGEPCGARDLLGRVAFMPQRDLLLPWRTVIDNAILAIEIEGTKRREARSRAAALLPEFGLAGFGGHYPQALSGGMRQRVALMRTFLFERDLMLLDEPFGALDALTRAMMQRWLLDVWQRRRRTVLFITHDVDESIFLADRVVVMSARPGRIVLETEIELSRPRAPDIITEPGFVALKRRVLDAIEAESIKAFQEMPP